MLVDLFSIPETTNLFYTNDIKVLIDILVRQLSDLSAGDMVRTLLNQLFPFDSHSICFSFANGTSNCVVAFCETLTTQNTNTAL
jgi:Protein of unknown function (DUF2013)